MNSLSQLLQNDSKANESISSNIFASTIQRQFGSLDVIIKEISDFKETVKNFAASQEVVFNETATNNLINALVCLPENCGELRKLPELLFLFRQSIPSKVQPSISTSTKAVFQRADNLVSEVVLGLARLALKLEGMDKAQGTLIPLAQGGHNWAFSNLKDIVVLVSKCRSENPVESYYLRQWCNEKTSNIGLPSAEIYAVSDSPVPYMITNLIPGEALGNLIWSAQIGDGTQINAQNALAGLGTYLNRIRQIHCDGAGPLEKNNGNFEFRGKYDTWGEYIYSYISNNLSESAILIDLQLLSLDQLRKLETIADQLSKLNLPNYLVHADPNRNNFFVSKDLSSYWCTDWDGSLAANDVEMLGRLYISWVERGTVYKSASERQGLFDQITKHLYNDQNERENILAYLKSWLCLNKFQECCNEITKLSKLNTPLEVTRNLKNLSQVLAELLN